MQVRSSRSDYDSNREGQEEIILFEKESISFHFRCAVGT